MGSMPKKRDWEIGGKTGKTGGNRGEMGENGATRLAHINTNIPSILLEVPLVALCVARV